MYDKKLVIAESLKKLYDKNAVIVDTETTGFSKTDEVIDLAVISFQTGQLIFQKYFIPQVKINHFAAKVHNLTLEKLIRLGADSIKNSFEELDLIFSSNYPIMAYNANFDERLLKQSLTKHSFEISNPAKWHCAMKAYEMLNGTQVKLEEACAKFNITAGQHSAKTDAIATRNLLLELMNGV